jgi:hypothetical protein
MQDVPRFVHNPRPLSVVGYSPSELFWPTMLPSTEERFEQQTTALVGLGRPCQGVACV